MESQRLLAKANRIEIEMRGLCGSAPPGAAGQQRQLESAPAGDEPTMDDPDRLALVPFDHLHGYELGDDERSTRPR